MRTWVIAIEHPIIGTLHLPLSREGLYEDFYSCKVISLTLLEENAGEISLKKHYLIEEMDATVSELGRVLSRLSADQR
jgi:hypothetical protein